MASSVRTNSRTPISSLHNKPLDDLQIRIARIEQSILIQNKLENKRPKFHIDKQKLRSKFFANHNQFKRKQFFDKYQGEARKNIQENFL